MSNRRSIPSSSNSIQSSSTDLIQSTISSPTPLSLNNSLLSSSLSQLIDPSFLMENQDENENFTDQHKNQSELIEEKNDSETNLKQQTKHSKHTIQTEEGEEPNIEDENGK